MNGFVGNHCAILVCVVWQTDGWTPLFAASDTGDVEVVMALVGAGAIVNQAKVRDDWWTVGAWCAWVIVVQLWGMHGS